ncbi:hypothetical protein V5H98_07640 [Georgenia sp. M64]|uniref:hypothetical protein n=1 Tax=Georgenia sp. M64 TaxID=3120520 RepID=UPI0030E372A2
MTPTLMCPGPLKSISMVSGAGASPASGPSGAAHHQGDPLRLERHALACAEDEGHTSPPVHVDPQPGRDEGVLSGVRRDAVDVGVPVELAQHDVPGRIEGAKAAHDGVPGSHDRLRVAQVGRRVHRGLAGDVEQVRDQHVQGDTGCLIEGGSIGDVERLGDVDLDLLDAPGVPLGPEEPVREAEGVDGLHGLLAEEVVDAEDLALGQELPDGGVELLPDDRRPGVLAGICRLSGGPRLRRNFVVATPDKHELGVDLLLIHHGFGSQPVLVDAGGPADEARPSRSAGSSLVRQSMDPFVAQ